MATDASSEARSSRWILLAGWSVFAIYAFPGFLSWDSITQFAQARAGVYTDDHPPVMAALWHFLEHFVHGPLLMLVIGSVPFLLGLARIFETVLRPRAAAFAAVAVLWFPPVGSLTAVVFKDTLMASFIVAGVPLVRSDSPRRRALGLAVLATATALRYNALAATFPIIVLLFRARPNLAGWRRYAVAMLAWIAVTGAGLGADLALADQHVHYWSRTQALQDIAGTLEYAPDLPDRELRALFNGVPLVVSDHIQAHFRAIYQPVDYHYLFRGANHVMDEPATPAQRDAVTRVWRTLLAAHPGAYLRYRWDNFVMLLRLDGAVYTNAYAGLWNPFQDDAASVVYDAGYGRFQGALIKGMIAISQTKLFDPFPYLVIALALLPLARRDPLAVALLLSGSLYELAWFVLAPTCDYRYSQWMVAMTVVGTVLTFVRRYRSRREPSWRPGPVSRLWRWSR